MAYRKLTSPRIFTGKRFLAGQTLITTETGRVIDLVDNSEVGEEVEHFEGVLCPGFINTHCHTELSHMKGTIPQNIGMVPFLMQVMFERHADESLKQAAIKQAIDDMYAAGIVGVGDTCNTSDSVAGKAGTQQVYFHNFIEASGFVPATAHTRLEQAIKTREKFLHYFPSPQCTITPHSPYSVSKKLMHLITTQGPGIISIHNQESQQEEDFIRNKTGEMLRLYEALGIDLSFFEPANMGSLPYTFSQLPADTRIILVHNCFTTTQDIEWIRQHGFSENVSFCLCPNANLYIGNPLPPITVLQGSGFPVCIGTDSLASNQKLSVLEELKTLQLHFPFLRTETLLEWGTLNGAKALMIDGDFGSFTKGTKPGVLLLTGVNENDSLKYASVKRVI